MNKKLLFGIFVMVLLVSVPVAEAGFFEDTWNWLMDLLGIGEEEAKEIALEMTGMDFNRNINPDGSYTIQMWGSIRNLQEDGEWKRIEDMRSLKKVYDEGLIRIQYLEDDGIHDFEIVDLNYTSLKVKPILKDLKELNKNIPIKVDGKIKNNINLNSLKGSEIEFTNENIFNHNYTFGEHSTTVKITTANIGNLDDASVNLNNNDNGGAKPDLQVYWNTPSLFRAYFRFNINETYIPSGQIITNATFYFFKHFHFDVHTLGLYEVYNNNWTEGTDPDWTDRSGENAENYITGGNQPCGSTPGAGNMDPIECNITAEDIITLDSEINLWRLIGATGVVATHYNQGRENTTFILVGSDEVGGANGMQFRSKEYATVSERPYLNVTYEVGNVAPTTPVLNAPLNNSLMPDDTYTFNLNWSNSTDVNGDAITYFLEVWNETAMSKLLYTNTSIDESTNTTGDYVTFPNETADYFWRVLAMDGILNSSWTELWNISINVTTTPNRVPNNIQIVAPSPANETITTNNTHTYNCSATDADGDTIYYEIYLDTSNPPTTLQSNETEASTNITNDGVNWWRCRAVDDKGGASSYSEIRLLTIDNSTLRNVTFVTPSPVVETSLNTFIATVTINKLTSQSISAEFIYNNTIYTPTKITIVDDDDLGVFNFSRTVTTPVGATSISLIWNLTVTLNNGSFVNLPHNFTQTVTGVEIKLCNSTAHIAAVNFTLKDELTGEEINASNVENATGNLTSLSVTFEFWVGNITAPTETKRYSSLNTSSNSSQYQFCIYPQANIITTDMDMEYDAEGYSPRTYYFNNATLDNITNEISLLLLADAEAIKFFIDVKQGLTAFTGATVTISKYNVGTGTFDVIGVRQTDNEGKFIEYLELDKLYKFFIVRNGISYGTIEKQSECQASPCELTLQIQEAVADFWQGYSDIFASSVAYTLDYDDETKVVTYTFNDLSGLAQDFRLEVTQIRLNETGGVICNEFSFATAGTLTCNLTGNEGNFKATGFISRSPEKIVNYIFIIISTIKDILGKNGILIGFFLVVIIGLVGAYNPSVGVALTAFAFLMMWMLEFIAIGLTSVILIMIFAIILMFYMKT